MRTVLSEMLEKDQYHEDVCKYVRKLQGEGFESVKDLYRLKEEDLSDLGMNKRDKRMMLEAIENARGDSTERQQEGMDSYSRTIEGESNEAENGSKPRSPSDVRREPREENRRIEQSMANLNLYGDTSSSRDLGITPSASPSAVLTANNMVNVCKGVVRNNKLKRFITMKVKFYAKTSDSIRAYGQQNLVNAILDDIENHNYVDNPQGEFLLEAKTDGYNRKSVDVVRVTVHKIASVGEVKYRVEIGLFHKAVQGEDVSGRSLGGSGNFGHPAVTGNSRKAAPEMPAGNSGKSGQKGSKKKRSDKSWLPHWS